jgi:hypothetical protein
MNVTPAPAALRFLAAHDDRRPWPDWTTMADPESNLFCVAEHHSTE